MVYLRMGSKDPTLMKFHFINYLRGEEEQSQPVIYLYPTFLDGFATVLQPFVRYNIAMFPTYYHHRTTTLYNKLMDVLKSTKNIMLLDFVIHKHNCIYQQDRLKTISHCNIWGQKKGFVSKSLNSW